MRASRRTSAPVPAAIFPLSRSRLAGRMMAGKEAGWAGTVARSLRQIGPARLMVTFLVLLIAIGLARFSWQLPLASAAERALYDMRYFRAVPIVDRQDPRIVLVYYDDNTLRQ